MNTMNMSHNKTSEAVPSQDKSAALNFSVPVANSSRRTRNDDRWDSLKEEIYDVYMVKDSTLQNTKRLIEESHGSVASVRKWKEKLKEWNFDKNISASDMSIIVSKAEKRAREEGKETAFFHGGAQITRERIEQFKRRKNFREDIAMLPSADTPENITYHTPRPESPEVIPLEPKESVPPIFENDELFSLDVLSPPRTAVSDSYRSARRPELATVLEMAAEGAIEDESASSGTTRAFNLSKALRQPEPIGVDMNTRDALLEQEFSALHGQCNHSMDISLRRDSPRHLNIRSGTLLSDTEAVDQRLKHLSLDLSENFGLDSSASATKGNPGTRYTIVESSASIRAQPVEGELTPPIPNTVMDLDEMACSLESGNLVSETPPRNLESDDSLLISVNTMPIASEATVKTALELHSRGWLTAAIFESLAGTEFEAQHQFCESLWKLGSLFERNHCMEEALMTYNLIQAGHHMARRLWTQNENTKCLIYKSRVLRKMKRFELSRVLFREAIKDIQDMEDQKCILELSLDLAEFLSALDRDSEAIHVLLDAFIGLSWWINTPDENQKFSKLLDCVQRIQSKTEIGEGLARVTAIMSRMKWVQARWIDAHSYHNLWVTLVQLGSHYLQSEKLELADLCFGSSPPCYNSTTSAIIRFRLAHFRKELFGHYHRQDKKLKSIRQLRFAFQQLLSLGPEDFDDIEEEDEESLVAVLEQLLNESCPKSLTESHKEDYSVTMRSWEKAKVDYDNLSSHRIQTRAYRAARHESVLDNQTESVSNWRQGATSLSSNGSSAFSRGSANSTFGVTYSVGSASSIVSNSAFMVP